MRTWLRLTILSLFVSIMACNPVSVSPNKTDLGAFVQGGVNLSSTTVDTKKNVTVKFSAGTIQGQTLGALSFAVKPGTLKLKTANGQFTILDPQAFQVSYTPNLSFVGVDQSIVYATDVYGNAVSGQVTVNVGNSLNILQPALAVRGMSCITCHSNVSSTILTDYGYGSPWYFDTASGDSFYADRLGQGNGLATLNLLQNSKIIVPVAQAPASIQTSFNISTLSQFIQARFAQGSTNQSSQVASIDSLKINIPTATRIRQLFNNPSAVQVYQPDTQNSPALSGLQYDSNNKVFKITSLVCDGDLFLGAPAVFENATVSSINGCRIYSTSSIFVDGTLQVTAFGGSTDFNLQLLSAESIWVGAGRINTNGAFCEMNSQQPTGWYSTASDTGGIDCTASANAANPQCDTLLQRSYQILVRNTFSNAYPDATSLNSLLSNALNSGGSLGAVAREKLNVEASLGFPLTDASCSAGRSQSLSRLLLVAPYVNNRFYGDFSGATIAEAALMSLGTFTFQFDPVFTKASVFSLLNSNELISGLGL